jgi:uncharacterized protein (TIGR03435 family)
MKGGFATAAIVALVTSIAAAQGKPAFDVATIKPADPNAVRNVVVPGSPGRMRIPSMTLAWLIYTAYGDGGLNTSFNVTGGPDWVKQRSFEVQGVAPGKPAPRELRMMLRTLLEDRFALKLRTETQPIDVFALVRDRSDGRLGPNIVPWDGTCSGGRAAAEEDDPARPRCLSGYLPPGLLVEGTTMFSVAEALSLPMGRAALGGMVEDRTGLAGRYTLKLEYPFGLPRRLDPAASPEFGPPSLVTAVREQWGLKLEPAKGSLKVLVVESAQLPTEN